MEDVSTFKVEKKSLLEDVKFVSQLLKLVLFLLSAFLSCPKRLIDVTN